jgi:PhnB protein
MAQLNAYLHFNGDCRDAMTFYKDIFGGELALMTVGDSQMASQMPPEAKNNIVHSTLTGDGIMLMGSDMMEPGEAVTGNRVTLCLVCKSADEIKNLYEKLSAGGKVKHPLKEEFFGTFGDFTDKFGINWMLQFGMGQQK